MTVSPRQPDRAAMKGCQQQTWASGNYARIGNILVLIGERLCEAVDLRVGQRLLDVAGQERLVADLGELAREKNVSGVETAVFPSECLEIVAVRQERFSGDPAPLSLADERCARTLSRRHGPNRSGM